MLSKWRTATLSRARERRKIHSSPGNFLHDSSVYSTAMAVPATPDSVRHVPADPVAAALAAAASASPAVKRAELRAAVGELRDRCLFQASAWAAEQLTGLPAMPSQSNPAAGDSREERGGRDGQAGISKAETRTGDAAGTKGTGGMMGEAEGEAKGGAKGQEAMEKEEDSDEVLFARSLFDVREFRRAAHVLEGVGGRRALFLRCYALYLAGEKRKEEIILETSSQQQTLPGTNQQQQQIPFPAHPTTSSPDNPASPVANPELPRVQAELERERAAGRLDAWERYLLGVVLAQRGREGEARVLLCESVREYPWNWAAWQQIEALCLDHDTYLSLLPALPCHWMTLFALSSLLLSLHRNPEALSLCLHLASPPSSSSTSSASSSSFSHSLSHSTQHAEGEQGGRGGLRDGDGGEGKGQGEATEGRRGGGERTGAATGGGVAGGATAGGAVGGGGGGGGFPHSTWVAAATATAHYNLRDFDSAEAVFTELTGVDPYRLEAMDTFSNILYVKEDFAGLSHLAHRVTKIDKYRPETCCIVGNYFSLKGRHERAVAYFRRALRLDRCYLSAWTLMGHEYVEMKNSAGAIQAYRRAVDINPRDYRAWYGLGQTYEILAMPYYALYYYRKAASLRPHDSRMWCAMGQCYEAQQLQQPEAAIRCYRRAVASNESEGLALHKLSKLYEGLGQMKQAAHFYKRNLDRMDSEQVEGPELVEALLFLATHHRSEGSLAEAERYSTRLLDFGGPAKEDAKALLREIRSFGADKVIVETALIENSHLASPPQSSAHDDAHVATTTASEASGRTEQPASEPMRDEERRLDDERRPDDCSPAAADVPSEATAVVHAVVGATAVVDAAEVIAAPADRPAMDAKGGGVEAEGMETEGTETEKLETEKTETKRMETESLEVEAAGSVAPTESVIASSSPVKAAVPDPAATAPTADANGSVTDAPDQITSAVVVEEAKAREAERGEERAAGNDFTNPEPTIAFEAPIGSQAPMDSAPAAADSVPSQPVEEPSQPVEQPLPQPPQPSQVTVESSQKSLESPQPVESQQPVQLPQPFEAQQAEIPQAENPPAETPQAEPMQQDSPLPAAPTGSTQQSAQQSAQQPAQLPAQKPAQPGGESAGAGMADAEMVGGDGVGKAQAMEEAGAGGDRRPHMFPPQAHMGAPNAHMPPPGHMGAPGHMPPGGDVVGMTVTEGIPMTMHPMHHPMHHTMPHGMPHGMPNAMPHAMPHAMPPGAVHPSQLNQQVSVLHPTPVHLSPTSMAMASSAKSEGAISAVPSLDQPLVLSRASALAALGADPEAWSRMSAVRRRVAVTGQVKKEICELKLQLGDVSQDEMVEQVSSACGLTQNVFMHEGVKEICELKLQLGDVSQDEMVEQVYRRYGVRLSRTTVSKILKDAPRWLRVSGAAAKQKRCRMAKFPQMEAALAHWYRQVSSMHANISDAMIVDKARQLSVELSILPDEFKVSDGWLYRFKRRHELPTARKRALPGIKPEDQMGEHGGALPSSQQDSPIGGLHSSMGPYGTMLPYGDPSHMHSATMAGGAAGGSSSQHPMLPHQHHMIPHDPSAMGAPAGSAAGAAGAGMGGSLAMPGMAGGSLQGLQGSRGMGSGAGGLDAGEGMEDVMEGSESYGESEEEEDEGMEGGSGGESGFGMGGGRWSAGGSGMGKRMQMAMASAMSGLSPVDMERYSQVKSLFAGALKKLESYPRL
ncbi:unnamed protein product [Closterium sp. Yama58-4]|nr:unnamed protein product [Closterium sp. Yama58-4]